MSKTKDVREREAAIAAMTELNWLYVPGETVRLQRIKRAFEAYMAALDAALPQGLNQISPPSNKEFVTALKESLEYCQIVDDAGSIDHEMSRWQIWVNLWKPIADEHGGI